MQVKVLFFGVLVEVTGSNCKFYSGAKSIGALKFMIQDEFPGIAHYNFCISLNNEIVNNDRNLKDGDEVALMPPFAGG